MSDDDVDTLGLQVTANAARLDRLRDSILRGVEASEAEEIVSMILRHSYFLVVNLENSKIVYASAAVERLFGYLEGELRGKDMHVLVPPDKRDIHQQHFKQYSEAPVTRQMGQAEMKLEGYRHDGTRFPIEIGLHSKALVSGRRVVHASVMPITRSHEV